MYILQVYFLFLILIYFGVALCVTAGDTALYFILHVVTCSHLLKLPTLPIWYIIEQKLWMRLL